MKNIYSVLLISLVFTTSFSQKLKDNFEYKVMYKLTFQLDSIDLESQKSEYMILYLGDEFSKYSSRAKTLANSIVRNGNSAHTAREALTNFHYEIIKQHNKKKLYFTLKIPKMEDRFYYPEDMGLFDWKIENETKLIKDYQAQKATTSYGGRDFEAWFTTEIPISDGPYKFNGLPGLILEIHDTKKYWNFEFFGLEKLPTKSSFNLNMNQYAKTNKVDLRNLWYRYRRDPMGYAKNPNVKITPEVHKKYVELFSKMLEKENNPLELN